MNILFFKRHSIRFTLALFGGLIFVSCSNTPVTEPPVDEDGYVLIWQDEFDSTQIDRKKWDFQFGTGTEYGLYAWGNNELQFYTNRSENIYLENGYLVIEARKEDFQGQSYTSARILTKGLESWTYGKFEASIKLPKTKGIWPAFWMLPEENAYGGWPASGEIDIMELLGHIPQTAYGTVHFGNSVSDRNYITGENTLQSGTFADDFHLFTVEWEADQIRWKIDGEQYHVVSKSQVSPYNWPFDQPFYLLLNVAVGGNWPGNPDQTTLFPQRMVVDYVRVYKKAE